MTESIADLLLISITIPPRDVEQLLDALARLPYSINADLKYEEWQTTVEFPAYRSWTPHVRAMLESRGFNAARLSERVPHTLSRNTLRAFGLQCDGRSTDETVCPTC